MTDISGFGLRMVVRASNTYPNGYEITQVADDADPLDMPSMQIADKAMTMNGQLLTWSTANPILATVAVVPNSPDDHALEYLVEANRPARGKTPARDVITLSIYYPDGSTRTLTQGAVTDGMVGLSPASAGRFKSKTYAFAFENTATNRSQSQQQ